MSHLAKQHDTSYQPPRKHVLLLSCLDPRLLDDTVDFMNHDNLTNRYDHVTMAGAALGALGGTGAPDQDCLRQAFDLQLKAAWKLHKFDDVYIVEHLDCGAYRKLFEVVDRNASFQEEVEKHWLYASRLRAHIEAMEFVDPCTVAKRKKRLKVHTFLMDLRGKVVPLTQATASEWSSDPLGPLGEPDECDPPQKQGKKSAKKRGK